MTKKKLFVPILLLFSIILFGACSEKKAVEDVAKNYLTAFKNFDMAEAGKYGTENTTIFLNEMQTYLDQIESSELQKTKQLMMKIEVIIDDASINEQKAKVTYHFKEEGMPVRKETLNLVKRNEKWLVDEDKRR